MQFYVPTIGDKLYLEKDWTFPLYQERRNSSLQEAMELERQMVPNPWGMGGYRHRDVVLGDVTLPRGTVLQVDRIYIRGKARSFDSITFYIADCPNKKLAPKKKGGTGRGRIRFWVKLRDANRILCALQPIDDIDAPVAEGSRFANIMAQEDYGGIPEQA